MQRKKKLTYQPIIDDVLFCTTGCVGIINDVAIASVKLAMLGVRNWRELLIDNAIDLFFTTAIVDHAGFSGSFWILVKCRGIKFRLNNFGDFANWVHNSRQFLFSLKLKPYARIVKYVLTWCLSSKANRLVEYFPIAKQWPEFCRFTSVEDSCHVGVWWVFLLFGETLPVPHCLCPLLWSGFLADPHKNACSEIPKSFFNTLLLTKTTNLITICSIVNNETIIGRQVCLEKWSFLDFSNLQCAILVGAAVQFDLCSRIALKRLIILCLDSFQLRHFDNLGTH